MWCCKCQKELSECTCADLQERLSSVAAGGLFVYRYCRKCGKHYAKCRCPEPIWAIKKNADG